MGFKCGIIGLPNVGKSTIFNALTKIGVKTANFPFCTIEKNIGIVPVPDLRLKKIANIVKSRCIFPTSIEFVDVAGLIKGASKGEGLGNQFLNNIRETEAISHVVRCFENNDIIHMTGKVNPLEDINIINNELILSDIDVCENAIYRLSKKNKKNFKEEDKIRIEILEKCLFQLEKVGALRTLDLKKEEKKLINYINFLTFKPMMYIANVNKDGLKNNPYLNQVYSLAKKENTIVVPICAIIESNLNKLNNKAQELFIKDFGLKDTGLNCIIKAGYTLLKLQTYFTAGMKEVRAWTIPIGTTALQAARKIHTDFEKGFIRAQIISYEDFIIYNGEQGVRKAGKIRLEGKKYVIKDGDIINFLFKI